MLLLQPRSFLCSLEETEVWDRIQRSWGRPVGSLEVNPAASESALRLEKVTELLQAVLDMPVS